MTGLKGTAVKLGVFALVGSLAFMLIHNTMSASIHESMASYEAEFNNVSGLKVGDNVRVAGVPVGKVTAIGVDGAHARVGIDVAVGQPILTTTTVAIRYQNLLGQRYVALVPGADGGSVVRPGSTLGLQQTDPGFDLTALLNGFKPLFDLLKPDDVNKLAQSIVEVLQGEGGTVEDLLQQTTKLTNFLADRDQVYGAVLQNLTPVLATLNGHNAQIRSTVSKLTGLMRGLSSERGQIGTSIDQMAALLGPTTDLATAAESPLINLTAQLRLAAAMFASNLVPLRRVITNFPLLLGALGRITSYENTINIYPCTLAVTALGQTAEVPVTKSHYSKVCGG